MSGCYLVMSMCLHYEVCKIKGYSTMEVDPTIGVYTHSPILVDKLLSNYTRPDTHSTCKTILQLHEYRT